jgi:hypothetical protein
MELNLESSARTCDRRRTECLPGKTEATEEFEKLLTEFSDLFTQSKNKEIKNMRHRRDP